MAREVSWTHPINRAWNAMKNRCDNPNMENYHRYGGRGITYTPSWASFDCFYADMKEGFKPGLFLDRKDNEGHYNKENCRWVTAAQSSQNTQRTLLDARKVVLIRALAQAKAPTAPKYVFNNLLAGLFKVSASTISAVVAGQRWQNVA